MADFKDVFTVVQNGEKEYWNRIGLAFPNKDGSLTVRLNALPLDGRLQIREPQPKNGPRAAA